jgi:hypothetical protein
VEIKVGYMSQYHFRIFYLEIIILTVMSVVAVGAAEKLGLGRDICGNETWKVVPYIYMHFEAMCRRGDLVLIVTSYYVASISLLSMFQVLYMRRRTYPYIYNKKMFAVVTAVAGFVLFAWATGRSSHNALFDFEFHTPGSWGMYSAPVLLSSFHFILSVLMVADREGGGDYARSS